MSARFYIGYVAVILCLVWGVELVLGSVYARYIIMYTGGIFLAGLIIGQRYEQAWLQRQQRLDSEHNQVTTAADSSEEGTGS
jgi:hypothetical protein